MYPYKMVSNARSEFFFGQEKLAGFLSGESVCDFYILIAKILYHSQIKIFASRRKEEMTAMQIESVV